MKLSIKLFFLLFVLQLSVKAQLRLPALVTDHMVLQRNVKIPIWGWAKSGETVKVIFKGKTYSAVAAADGKWALKMDIESAGGPFELLIKGASEQIILKDVLVGDVWICSGQSNMVFNFNNGRAKALYAEDIAKSANDQIRQILVQNITSSSPLVNFKTNGWKSARPEILNSFSSAAYFFARELHNKYKIPIGLINTSWGGTKAEAWISADAIKAFPQFDQELKLLQDTIQIAAKLNERKQAISDWHTKNTTEDKGYSNGKAVWAAPDFDDAAWKTTVAPVMFDKMGFPNTYGVMWFRKEITIDNEFVGKNAVLKLGSVDDEDETFVNGVRVGGYANREKAREHQVPGNLIKAGKNIITVRVINWNGPAGFSGSEPMRLDFGNNSQLALNGIWKYQPGRITGQLPGNYNVQDLSSSLYNGMIAPLIPYAIKGVIWYQGENNGTRGIEYRSLFPALIANWRSKWGQGDFPFVFQQLVNYRPVVKEPGLSDWATLREAQFMTLAQSPNTAMAVGIDLGEEGDIHPVNKLDVGKRLALAAEKIAYREKNLVSSGPLYKSIKIEKDKIRIDFTSTGSGLMAKGEIPLKYFAIAGEDKKFYWATAEIKGNQVLVFNPAVPNPIAVRYAWSDNPEGCNLYNKEGLPASPFRTDDWNGSVSGK